MVFEVPNQLEDNHCFCCGPLNPDGMHLSFFRRGEALCCEWQPEARFVGFAQVLHGGIQASLLDEVSVWAVAVFHGRMAATASFSLEYVLPVKMTMKLMAVARVVRVDGDDYHVEAELQGEDGRARTTSQARLRALSPGQFRRFTGWKHIPPGWSALFSHNGPQ